MTDVVSTREAAWVRQLKTAKNRAQHEIVAFGKLLIQCKAAVGHGSFGKVLDEVGMSSTSAHRLMTISENPVLANPSHGGNLPSSYRTLAELARLSKPELEAAIADGRVFAEMTRAEAEALVPKKSKPAGEGAGPSPDPAPISDDEPVPGMSSDGGAGDPATRAPGAPEELEQGAATRKGAESGGRADAAAGTGPLPPAPAPLEGASVAAATGDDNRSEPLASQAGVVPSPSASAPARATGSEPADPEDTSPSRSAAEERGGSQPPRPAPSSNGSDLTEKEKHRQAERYQAGELIHNSVLFIADALEVDGWKSVGVYLAKHPDCADGLHRAAHRVAEAIGQIEAMAIT